MRRTWASLSREEKDEILKNAASSYKVPRTYRKNENGDFVEVAPTVASSSASAEKAAQAVIDFEAALQAQQEIYGATGFANLRDVNAMNLPTAQYSKDWTAEQEEELAKMRDELMNTGRIQREFIGTGIEYNPNVRQGTQTEEDLIAAYQEQLAKRNAASPNATSGFMPVDPTKQTVGTYAAESGLAGLVGSLEGSRNFVVDLAAENARNNMYELLASQSASGVDPTALIDAQRAAGISTQPQIDPNVLAAEIGQRRDTSASRAMQERLADYNVNPQSAVGIAGNVAAGVGGMLPAIGANLLVPGSGSAVMFSSAAGQATSEALAAGADYDEAFTYGVVSGATEIATEKILGGIPGLNKGWADDLLNKGIARISTSPVGRFLIKTGVDALGEGFEEWLSEAIGQYTVRIYDEDERNRSVMDVATEGRDDRLYAALIGALTSLAMQAPTVNANNVAQYNAELTKIRGGIENALVEEGMTAQEAQQTAAAMVEQAQTEIATTTPAQTAQTEAQQTTDILSAETPQTGAQASRVRADSNKLDSSQAQLFNILVSNIFSEAQRGNRVSNDLIRQAYDAAADINIFSPTKADVKLAAAVLEPIVKQIGNENYYSYIDKIRSLGEAAEESSSTMVQNPPTQQQIEDELVSMVTGEPIQNIVTQKNNALTSTADDANNKNGGKNYGNDAEFRELQRESQGMSEDLRKLYRSGVRKVDEALRGRLSRVFSGRLGAERSKISDANGLLRLSGKNGAEFEVLQDVTGQTFHDVFDIARNYLMNGELVDVHDVETSENGIGYNDCRNYLSSDGLSGFSITPDGDLISVFNLGDKKGFLRAIKDIVKSDAKTLDCYMSDKQPLSKMYQKIFGFKIASVMAYNMEYDHDDIAKNHDMPNVAFMVNTDAEVETRYFNKDQYDEAVAYQQKIINEEQDSHNPKPSDSQFAPNPIGAAQSKAVKSGTGEAARVLPNDATYETANNVLAIVDPRMMELGERIKSGFRELYRYTVSGQAALEYADKAQGSDSVINAVTQLARQAGGTVDTICESMLVSPDPGEGAKPLDVSYNEIIQMVPREQWSDYNDYRQHLHNIDRMSLRDELAVESAVDEYNAFIAENPEYETYADSYIQKLAKTGGDGNPASVYLALKEAVDEANEKVNKPVVGKSDGTPYTAAESAEIVAEYDKAHPEWREYVNRQNKWWDNAMHAWLVDSGLITEDAYQTMRQMYPNYIPTYRVESKSGSSPVYGNRIKAKPVGKAEGGVSPIIPLEEQFIKQINKIVRQERLNEIGIELLNFARQDPQAAAMSGIALKTDVQDGLVDAVTADSIYNEADEVKGLRQLEDGTYTFTVMEQGKPVVLNVSKEVYESIDWLRTSGLGEIATKITKLFGGISNPIKSGITGYNPLFIISNFVRDIQTYAVNSTKGGSHWVSNYFKAAQEILKKGDQYNELKALGGLRSGYYNSKEGYTATLPKNTTWDKVKRIAGTPIRGIENISQFIESIPRMAEYMNIIEKEGNTPAGRKRAALASQDVTTNFTRNAPVSKVANSFVLYLNASIQGIDKTVRQIKSKPGQTLAGAGLSVALPSIILAIVNAANPNYDELDERTKDQYYCIPNLFGERDEEGYAKTFFKLPRSREYGVVLGASFDRLLRGLETKEWGEAFDGILAQAWTNFAPPDIMQDNLWSMAARVDLFDEDSPGETWYGGDIVPSRLQDLPPEMQYDVNTSNLAKNIGQATGLSPKKIDNIIDSYGGYAADLLLAATSPKNEGANFGESVWNTFDSTFLMPAERRFTADPRYSSGVVDDFYDAYDEITKEANAMNYTEDFPIAIKTPSEVAKSEMTSIASAMSDLYAKEREVWASTGSLRDKQREADAIREQINELASEYEESVRVKMEKQQEIIGDLVDILTEQGFYDYARAAGGENNEITQDEAKQILDDMDELSLEEKKRVWKLTGLMLKEAGWKKEYNPN